MQRLSEVTVPSAGLARLADVLSPEQLAEIENRGARAPDLLAGRTVWNINSTATGGGVAELLNSLLPYVRGIGVDSRWLVIGGDPEFFTITKRIHNGLHGVAGDGGDLGVAEREHYVDVSIENAHELQALVNPGDVVILHDPQTAGLVGPMRAAGAKVVWRCHVGPDEDNVYVERSWDFLREFVEDADAFVFSRESYVPSWADQKRDWVIPPSIDPFTPKNQAMDALTSRAILGHVGIIRQQEGDPPRMFTMPDGSPARVNRYADVVRTGHAPSAGSPLVVQISRWDRLKDMAGVMHGFAEHVADYSDSHLALVGPNVSGVVDDPEGAEVLDECIAAWRELPHGARSRIQLVCLPMIDINENAAIVNALQRHANVIVQKSLHEGFGLTVTEAMWKARPVVASDVGGISEQIVHGESGILLDDPSDLDLFGQTVRELVVDDAIRDSLGRSAHLRARELFLPDRHLGQYFDLLRQVLGSSAGP